MKKIPLVICGAHGRMGRELIAMVETRDEFFIKAVVVKTQDESFCFPSYDDVSDALTHHAPAVVVDFSTANCALHNLAAVAHHQQPYLLATTGHDHDELNAALDDARTQCAVVVAPNTSLMANLMMALCSLASARLPTCSASVLDIHHEHKKDRPSGTALALANGISSAHPARDVDVTSMRKGNVAGDHTAYFFGDYDRLEITHRVVDRRIFAEGALVAAQFLFGRDPGLYDMNDVLNLDLTINK